MIMRIQIIIDDISGFPTEAFGNDSDKRLLRRFAPRNDTMNNAMDDTMNLLKSSLKGLY